MSIARSRRELAVDVGVPNWADPGRYVPLAHALAGKKNPLLRPRAGRARFALPLMALSFLGGAWSRDSLSTRQAEAAHAALSQSMGWIADRVAALRGAPTANTAGAAPPRATAISAPPATAAIAPRASTPEPPEVSFSSLPRAPIQTHKALVRAPISAAPPPPVHTRPSPTPAVEDVSTAPAAPVQARAVPAPAADAIPDAVAAPAHARTAPSKPPPEADPADLIPEPKAATESARATTSPRARTNDAPLPAPGSLEDLIRKEVQKEQSGKH